ncbi:MAG: hypothetical protein GXO32_08880 [Crenarchaeota archaeon]|nr:hypothetical protein [Thermoproteota archaeon]
MGTLLGAALGIASSRRSREEVTIACLSSLSNVVFLAFPMSIAVLSS